MLFSEEPSDKGVQGFTSTQCSSLTSPVIAQEAVSLQVVILDGVMQVLRGRSAMYEAVLRLDPG